MFAVDVCADEKVARLIREGANLDLHISGQRAVVMVRMLVKRMTCRQSATAAAPLLGPGCSLV